MATSLIGLGSNLGDSGTLLTRALALMEARGLVVDRTSSLHRTAPVGGPPGQPDYTNAAAVVRSPQTARGLLSVLAAIEDELGRTREVRWGARTLDLDLLLHDREVIRTPDLVVPHPRMAVRRFVLTPACEIAADMVHPTVGWTLQQILTHLESRDTELEIVAVPAALTDDLVVCCLASYPERICVVDPLEPREWPPGAAIRLRQQGRVAAVTRSAAGRPGRPAPITVVVDPPSEIMAAWQARAAADNDFELDTLLAEAAVLAERVAAGNLGIFVQIHAATRDATIEEVLAVLQSACPGLGPPTRSGVQWGDAPHWL